MGKWSALRGALVWTILPYIGSRIDRLYNDIVGEELDGRSLTNWKKVLRSIYPYIYALFGLLQTFYRFRYLYLQGEKEEYYYHLLYRIEKLHLRRAPSPSE